MRQLPLINTRSISLLAWLLCFGFAPQLLAQIDKSTELAESIAKGSIAKESIAKEPEERWYQVEIILFTQPDSGAPQELWHTDLALAYPPNWVQLKDPLETRDTTNNIKEDTNIDFGKLLAGTAPEESGSPATAIESPATLESHAILESPATLEKSTEPTELELIPTHSDAPPIVANLEREPFYFLPSELRQLNDKATALKRSRNYRVLFHQAWRQPVLSEAEAPSLLISAGETYGEHRELEGSLSLSVARYLHLKTNLWLTEFAHNFGQQQRNWPTLPVRPDLRQYNNPQRQSEGTELSLWDTITPLHNEYELILSTPYVPERITRLKQKRRMRSQEIHYIDHPKIGLIILSTPYTLPEIIENEKMPHKSNDASHSKAPDITTDSKPTVNRPCSTRHSSSVMQKHNP